MRSVSTPLISKRTLVFGTFDRLHPGHLFFLGRALEHGPLTIVVARDRTVLRTKKRKPIESQDVRCRSLREALPGAEVVLGHPSDFLAPVRRIRPRRILLGYDQKLPPGVRFEELPCPVDRIEAFLPSIFKSSVLRVSQELASIP